jgi:excinuclease ABC subunit C
MSTLEHLKEIVATFPLMPGVYLMKNQAGQVLYVGKALQLKARVRSYLGGGDGRRQIPYLMQHVATIEAIVCENENQALILERDLIRTHQPIYNIKLKDDKAYLLIRIDRESQWPRLEVVRRKAKDGALYLGPFVSNHQLREVLDLIRRVIPLRTCTDVVLHNRQRPCLEYQIKRCLGPCCLPVDEQEYRNQLDMAVEILQGRANRIVSVIEEQMNEASGQLRFELAAGLRDKLVQLEEWVKGNQNVHHYGVDRHAFGFSRDGERAVLNVLHTREGRIAHSENYSFESVWMDDGEFLEEAIERYYGDGGESSFRKGRAVPAETIVPLPLEELGMLECALTRMRKSQGDDSAVEVIHPKRGIRYRLMELARINAQSYFSTIFRSEAKHMLVVEEMKSVFGLRQLPRRIECMDISNLQGSDIVGAVVVFIDGAPARSEYRRYTLRRESPDDFASIREVTLRRLKSAMETGEFPDLLVIDGGRGQLNAALQARDYLGLEVEIISIAKIREEGGLERIFVEGRESPVSLPDGSQLTLFMQRVRDEVHKYVLGFHRDRRMSRMLSSSIDTLPGIGPARRKRLMAAFGSLDAMKVASRSELARVGRMSPLLADKLLEFLNRNA